MPVDNAANRDAAYEAAARADEAARGGELRRAVELLERASAILPNEADLQRRLGEARMRYARDRDVRNREANPPGRAGGGAPGFHIPLPQAVEGWIGRVVGPARVQGVVAMLLALLLLLLLRIALMGRSIASVLGTLPGDVNVKGSNYSFHFPIVSCVIMCSCESCLGVSGGRRGTPEARGGGSRQRVSQPPLTTTDHPPKGGSRRGEEARSFTGASSSARSNEIRYERARESEGERGRGTEGV